MRDKRLTLELLDEIARAADNPHPMRSFDMGWERPGWTSQQVWRKLSELKEDGLIRTQDELQTGPVPGDPSVMIWGLTTKGWAQYDQLRRPVRSWLARRWMWVIGTVLATIGTAAAVLALL